MALKVLLLRKDISDKQKALAELQRAAEGFAAREAELEADIAEVSSEEERGVVEEAVGAFDTERTENAAEVERLNGEIAELERQIAEIESTAAAARSKPPEGEERKEIKMPNMATAETRTRFFGMTVSQRDAFMAREEVKEFLVRLRELKGAKRSITGSELGIPDVMLDILRDNIDRYSKLMKYMTVKQVKGTSRQNIAGTVPEAIWTEAIANLNELDFVFTQVEFDGYKVGGYLAIPNSTIEDDVGLELVATVMDMMGQAIGLSVDKASAYGTGDKMPVGFVTRLAATAKPSWWGSNQGPFTDLHTSNILRLNIGSNTKEEFFQPLLAALGVPSPKYSNGTPVWIMNRKTHVDIVSRCLAFDFNAALLAGMNSTMPVIGGDIVELEFMADFDIAGGYLGLQFLVERSGAHIRSSDIPLMLQDQTLFAATQRFDGKPVRGEAFILLNYKNAAPTTAIPFGTDYANSDIGTLIVTTAAGTASGATRATVAGAASNSMLKYKLGGTAIPVKNGQKLGAGWADYISSTTDITATTGSYITVAEVDADGKAIGVGAGVVTSAS